MVLLLSVTALYYPRSLESQRCLSVFLTMQGLPWYSKKFQIVTEGIKINSLDMTSKIQSLNIISQSECSG